MMSICPSILRRTPIAAHDDSESDGAEAVRLPTVLLPTVPTLPLPEDQAATDGADSSEGNADAAAGDNASEQPAEAA